MIASFLVAGSGALDACFAQKAELLGVRVVHGIFAQKEHSATDTGASELKHNANFLQFFSSSASLISVRSLFMQTEKFCTIFDRIVFVFDAKHFSALYPASRDNAFFGGAAVNGMVDEMLFPYVYLAHEALAAVAKYTNVKLFFVFRDAPPDANHLVHGLSASFCAFAKSIAAQNAAAAAFFRYPAKLSDEECAAEFFDDAHLASAKSGAKSIVNTKTFFRAFFRKIRRF
ncbi:MAG: hypothetical protein Ta2A_16280 [Treponemataceae bacterium]|nr:MAG: hypothetical protein Ta2A_16280 [Treponemataceae bacterium]